MTTVTRVLHLITRYLDGGAETTTRNTLKALSKAERTYDLRLGTGAEYDSERLRELEQEDITTHVFRNILHYNPVTAVLAVFSVAWYLHREDIDVLHTHSTEAGIIGRLAGFLAGTPIVVHEIHGDPITADRHFLLNTFLLFAERISALLADRIIVKSERIREMYLDRGIGRSEQYELIYHGVNIERFRETTEADPSNVSNNDDAVCRLLFVGRLADGKGLFDLLTAVERLDGIHLDIVGDGPLRSMLEETAYDRDLPVDVLGYRDDIPKRMARADVFVLPSYREGTPRVITEALAAGLPVVATDIAGIPEQVDDGETGYLVEPGDIDALVTALQKLIDCPARRERFGASGRERVEAFDITTAQERYRELYRELTQR